MKIYIPTLGRIDNQTTFNNLPNELKLKTILVVQPHEEKELRKLHNNIMVLPVHIKGIGKTRQYIIEQCKDNKLLFIDDDLKFLKRLPNLNKLKPCTDKEIIEMAQWLEDKIEHGYPLAGISSQQGNHVHKTHEVLLSRIYAIYSINVDILKNLNIRFDEIELMEDFNVQLRLIRNGMQTILNSHFAHAQKNANAKGGCSDIRNIENQSKSARLLAKLHYPYVKVVKKQSKSWEGMEEREDVKIYWKKAYQNSV
tara:strand:+ start:1843 stop:2604 length:762 start_codon:yes stop_codon:yes gene_type:complete